MKNKGSMSRKATKIGQSIVPTNTFREEGAAQKNNRHARRRDAKLAKKDDQK
ncbi:hypothetical protein JQ617_03345 [Bradyrhizobium sp. KB893862 SZCCT0404]|uniref:hypothetical protein n=1 Tax=Bradyrhizobium sp. KB893862 SZCCT0404 TaxID=2807672 RepID=UPI001BA48249|nr:hypothetical protein [Bradyrhizobium sp. KB893862 SZCCT0404]MBR1172980.1 hypothetical protein [Bradyrhizobium sp. KB893862 SZCCT0404]